MSSLSNIHTTAVLLAVRNLREEVRAGFGHTMLTVRTLDDVSLALRRGEMVVVRGGVASGARSLIGVISGARPVTRIHGERVVSRGVQIRRASISLDAMRIMLSAWSTPRTDHRPSAPGLRSVVYVFRVRTTSLTAGPTDTAQWAEWTEQIRARGASVLAHVPTSQSLGFMRHAHAATEQTPANRREVRESAAGTSAPYAFSTVRLLTLASGRLVSEGSPAATESPD